MADNLRKFTTQEVLNKVYTDSSGDTIGLQSQTSKETLNAVLNTSTNSLNVSLSGSNTISGDVTITGDLTVQGNGTGNYDEIVQGNLEISETLRLNPTISSGSATTLAFMRSGTNKWRFLQPHDDSYLKLYNDGASATQMYFKSDNTIGIETNTPFAVRPDGSTTNISGLQITNSTSGEDAVLSLRNDNNTQGLDIWSDTNAGTAYIDNIFDGAGADINFRVRTLGTTIHAMTIDGAGNIGIGENSPNQLLHLKATNGSEMVLQRTSGDTSSLLGGIHFGNSDVDEYLSSIYSYQDGATDSAYLSFETEGTGGAKTERMRITSTGAVSIGPSVPTAGTLVVSHATDSSIVIQSAVDSGSDASLFFKVASGTDNTNKKAGIVFRDTGTNGIGDLYFLNDSTADGNNATVADNTAMVIKSAGNVGIGTTGPSNKLTVEDTIGIKRSGVAAITTLQMTGAGFEVNGHSGYNPLIIQADGSEKLRVTSDGNVGIGVTPETSHSSVINLQIGGLSNITSTAAQSAGGSTWLGNNVYINSSGAQAHIVTDEASVYRQVSGTHNFQTVASGSADASISFTTNMVLDINSRISLSNNDNNSQNTVFGQSAFNAGSDNASDDNVAIGHLAMGTGTVSGAINNVAVGRSALTDITSADNNTAIGYASAQNITLGERNTVLGADALGLSTTGLRNVAIGNLAMYTSPAGVAVADMIAIGKSALGGGVHTTDANGAIAIGTEAGTKITEAIGNLAIGYKALAENTTGDSNTAVGYQSQRDFVEGAYNTSLGYSALGGLHDTTADASNENTAVGHNALAGDWSSNVCSFNVAVGAYTLDAAMNGALANTAVGTSSLTSVDTGDENTAVGKDAGQSVTSGSNNSLFGHDAGDLISTGSNNTIIGATADSSANSASNQTVVGYGATGQADNSVTLGNASATHLYLPNNAKIAGYGATTVADDATITVCSSTAGSVLVSVYNISDGYGMLAWFDYASTGTKLAGGSNTDIADTDAKICLISASNNNTITFKNRLGSSKNFHIVSYSAFAT